LCAVVTAMLGCATAPPSRELTAARHAYAVAEASLAAELQPGALLSARDALTTAEQAHKTAPGSASETHLAYLAQRKSELAVAHAEISAAKSAEDKAHAKRREQLEWVVPAEAGASVNRIELQRPPGDEAGEAKAGEPLAP
jgi:hypothetical protein